MPSRARLPRKPCGRQNGKPWNPAYEPLWSALEQPTFHSFHELVTSSRHSDYFNPSLVAASGSQPLEQMLAVSAVVGGVLHRHCVCGSRFEANCSWVPPILWRMDECFEPRATSS